MYIKHKIKFIDKSNCKNDNFYCSICEYPFLTFLDFQKSKEYNTCNKCYVNFIEAKREDCGRSRAR